MKTNCLTVSSNCLVLSVVSKEGLTVQIELAQHGYLSWLFLTLRISSSSCPSPDDINMLRWLSYFRDIIQPTYYLPLNQLLLTFPCWDSENSTLGLRLTLAKRTEKRSTHDLSRSLLLISSFATWPESPSKDLLSYPIFKVFMFSTAAPSALDLF